MLTPKRIRDALVACDGSRKDAAKRLGCSPDTLRIQMRKFRLAGEDFPDAENEVSRAAKFYGLVEPGQWVEYGRTQELCEVAELKHGMALVRYEDGHSEWVGKRQLAWVPSGDVIADETRKIREGWPPGEFGKRARWAHCGEYEIPQVAVEEDSRDDTW